MGEQRPAIHKIWMVEYGRGFFRFNCRGCGLPTRERVYHLDAEYLREDGGTPFIRSSAPWHRRCHDQVCQDDFCVKQQLRRLRNVFGTHIAEVVKALDDMTKTVDVPNFLSSPHPGLNGLSPLCVIWRHGSWGFERVMRIIEDEGARKAAQEAAEGSPKKTELAVKLEEVTGP